MARTKSKFSKVWKPSASDPAMYIGSTGPSGLHHLVYEIVDNSIDEALAGFCDRSTSPSTSTASITVVDDGRGIPTDQHTSGRSAAEVVLTDPARRRQVRQRQPTKCRAVCTASACRSSMRCRSELESGDPARRPGVQAGVRARQAGRRSRNHRHHQDAAARKSRSSPMPRFSKPSSSASTRWRSACASSPS